MSVRVFTCDMLRLHGACLHQERLSALERQDGLADQPALSLRRVPAVVQLDDLLEVSRLPVGRDAVLVGSGLDAVHDRSRRAEDRRAGTLQVSSCSREKKIKFDSFQTVYTTD